MKTEDFELAKSDIEAEKKSKNYKIADPYPEISAALLNSADILAYIKATSLIYPFDENKLRGASYDVKILGEVVYWDMDGNKQSILLEKEGQYFDLCPNSIAFVTLEPTFRIPDYLALRFNLKITHIYKGLLLGTGPLVDPGFVGRLSIPLHNLTANTYRFHAYDSLITMEFTKMSPNKRWDNSAYESQEEYKPNKITENRSVSEYIGKALKKDGLNTVISSIPKAMLDSRESAEKSEKAVMEVKKAASIQAIISVIAVCTLIISCVGFSLNALNKANDRYDELMKEYEISKTEYTKRIENLESEVADLVVLIENTDNSDNVIKSNAQLD